MFQNGFGQRRRNVSLTSWECSKEEKSHDYTYRLCGHSNAHTDIKEATYIGERGEFIAAGSDDGNIFVWEKSTGKIVRVLNSDKSIVNCVQWNPSSPLLASSGIEEVVRLWEPKPSFHNEERLVHDVYKACRDNQRRMKIDPFEVMLMRMGFNLGGARGREDEEGGEAEGEEERGGTREQERGSGRREDDGLGHAWIEDRTSCRQS